MTSRKSNISLPLLRLSFFLIVAISLITGCATSTPEFQTLQDKSLLLEKELQEMKGVLTSEQEKRNVTMNMVTLFRDRISDLEGKIQNLESQIPKTPVVPEEIPASEITSTARPDTLPPSPVTPSSRLPAETVDHLYQTGLQALVDGHYTKALQDLREITRLFPAHPLADNAQYWIGEIYYSQRDFKSAILEFRKVIDLFPGGNKAPDAHLKVAYSLLELGKDQEARIELEEVLTLYPSDEVTETTRKKLESMTHAK